MINEEVRRILETAKVGRLALCCDGQPYVVPLNFVYENRHIYFHSADRGMKIEFLRRNPRICFEVDEYVATIPGPIACKYDTAFRSVIAFGTGTVVEDPEEKTRALRLIVGKYAGPEMAERLEAETVEGYRSSQGRRTVIVAMTIERLTGKSHGLELA